MSNDEKEIKDNLSDLFDFIGKNIDKTKMSKKNKQSIADEMSKLRNFILEARPARIAIVGRRGAGKSSLINAIFREERAEVGDYKSTTGAGKWYMFENDLGGIDILDTRGLGESDLPDEAVKEKNPVLEINASLKEKCPDVILFLCKAKEVGARLEEDIKQLSDIKNKVKDYHQYDVPIVGIVTQVDELAPVSVSEPPFDDAKKQANIAATVDLLGEKLTEQLKAPVAVIPISAYIEYDDQGNISYDRSWNIDQLLHYLMTELPDDAQVILAKISKVKSVQKSLARTVGRSVAGVTGIVGATPIPVADMPVITGLQLSMVSSIAIIGGTKLNRQAIGKFLGAMGLNVGAGFVLRTISRQLVKIFPGAGSVISGAIATAGTYALCEAAIVYFIERKSEEEAKKVFDQEYKERKDG